MTCKDCIHYDDCLNDERTRYYSATISCNVVEKHCDFFKDKTDFVEVVRCVKCKYRVTHTCPITGIKTLFCDYGISPVAVEPTHFCSYGERRTDNDL